MSVERALRVYTAGNIDDGKSTLIGRLLYDTHSITQDQLSAYNGLSEKLGYSELHLALLTDGLRAEREGAITIDVAHRYFNSRSRNYILLDCPGHAEYTKNLLSAASIADVAVLVVDGSRNISEQTLRHLRIASLLRLKAAVICVNKMDLLSYSQESFEKITQELQMFLLQLEIPKTVFVPICALHGENVAGLSKKTSWYHGQSLLETLDSMEFSEESKKIPFRFPIQLTRLPGVALGRVESGTVRVGDGVKILPQDLTAVVESIRFSNKEIPEAVAGQSVEIRLGGGCPLRRGDVICCSEQPMRVSNEIGGTYFCIEPELEKNEPLELRCMTQAVPCGFVSDGSLVTNQISSIRMLTEQAIAFDSYAVNPTTGSFILIRPGSGAVVGIGLFD